MQLSIKALLEDVKEECYPEAERVPHDLKERVAFYERQLCLIANAATNGLQLLERKENEQIHQANS